jgi:phage FluMu protein Com
MHEVRCKHCNKKFGDYLTIIGTHRCERCKKDNHLNIK